MHMLDEKLPTFARRIIGQIDRELAEVNGNPTVSSASGPLVHTLRAARKLGAET